MIEQLPTSRGKAYEKVHQATHISVIADATSRSRGAARALMNHAVNKQRACFLRRAARQRCRPSLGIDLVLSYCFEIKREDALPMPQARYAARRRSAIRMIFGRES